MSADRRAKERGLQLPSVYEGLDPLAAVLLARSAARFDAEQFRQRERRRFERNLAAARAGLAANPTWGESGLEAGAL